MTRYFCTYFDSNYLARGLVMCRSLQRQCPHATIFVLALDRDCHDFLNRAENHHLHIIPVGLSELEEFDKALLETKGTRNRAEYIFTTTPCLPRYLLNRHPEIDFITYLDADLYFFSSPEPIFLELVGSAGGIIPHRFAANVRYMAEQRGIYNVGWVSFANNQAGRACLEWYRERCIEWCYDRVEPGRFADQKYLDHFKEIAPEIVVIRHLGANLAPWNLGSHKLELKEEGLFVGSDRLIFFHYQGLKRCFGPYYDCGLFAFRLRLPKPIRKALFLPYITEVTSTRKTECAMLPDFTYGHRYPSKIPFLNAVATYFFHHLKLILGYCVRCPEPER